eukprot:TRINITY_DN112087_c0_g1_i1.p3 TRINITY_DN112087_c0_g1~~TRINITY_DN112087_c0_g1_i1.p3  ORF type:complete len:215 (+),score=65.92 TRINITY_DN112087_c0_g1_i1:80-724(+)
MPLRRSMKLLPFARRDSGMRFFDSRRARRTTGLALLVVGALAFAHTCCEAFVPGPASRMTAILSATAAAAAASLGAGQADALIQDTNGWTQGAMLGTKVNWLAPFNDQAKRNVEDMFAPPVEKVVEKPFFASWPAWMQVAVPCVLVGVFAVAGAKINGEWIEPREEKEQRKTKNLFKMNELMEMQAQAMAKAEEEAAEAKKAGKGMEEDFILNK